MEQGILEWIAGQTGIMGIAGMALIFLRRAYDTSLQREKQYAEENRADKLMMITALQENSRTLAEINSTNVRIFAEIKALLEGFKHERNRS